MLVHGALDDLRRHLKMLFGKVEPEVAGMNKADKVSAFVSNLEQFTMLSEAEVLKLHGVGPKALEQRRRALTTNGLSFVPERGKKG